MVTLNEETTIPSPPAVVWPLLRDPEVVAECIPGAQLAEDAQDGMWRGSIRVKFGPTVAVFKGEATLVFDDAARRLTIDGRGIDGRGASRALASSVVSLEGGEVTTLRVQGEFNVTGPLETFVNAGGVHVARALLAEFSANMAAVVAGRSAEEDEPEEITQPGRAPVTATAPAPAAAAPPSPAADSPGESGTPAPDAAAPARATELGAGALLWRVLTGWIKSLFNKRN